jgi:hypothetical protein
VFHWHRYVIEENSLHRYPNIDYEEVDNIEFNEFQVWKLFYMSIVVRKTSFIFLLIKQEYFFSRNLTRNSWSWFVLFLLKKINLTKYSPQWCGHGIFNYGLLMSITWIFYVFFKVEMYNWTDWITVEEEPIYLYKNWFEISKETIDSIFYQIVMAEAE